MASSPRHDAEPVPLRELTARLASGSDAAWGRFHSEYGPDIFRLLLAATSGDHHLANEALQQTYLRVARNVRACDSEAMFRGWLRVVARSALKDCWRRRGSWWKLLRRRAVEPEGLDGCLPEESRLWRALDSALAQITPEDRALLQAKYFSGAKVDQIAAKLSISPKAAESRLARARAELRVLLERLLKHHE